MLRVRAYQINCATPLVIVSSLYMHQLVKSMVNWNIYIDNIMTSNVSYLKNSRSSQFGRSILRLLCTRLVIDSYEFLHLTNSICDCNCYCNCHIIKLPYHIFSTIVCIYQHHNQQPTTNNQQPTTNNQQPTTNHQPTTTNQPPTTTQSQN